MIFPNLAAEGINLSTAFIFLAWEEMFSEKTPDTYRVKLHDTLSLLVELSEVAHQALADQRWVPHLQLVLEELQAEAESDRVFTLHYPSLRVAISQAGNSLAASRAALLAETARGMMEDYDKKLSDYFMQKLVELPKKKEEVLNAVRRVGTRALHQGLTLTDCIDDSESTVRRVGTRALHQGLTSGECRDYLDNSLLHLDPSDLGEKLLSSLMRGRQRWFCIFAIKGNRDEIDALLYKSTFKQLPKSRKPLGKTGADFLEQTKDAWLACIEVEATGRNEALQSAVRPLRQIFDVANFYQRSTPFSLLPLVYLAAGDDQYVMRLDAEPYGGLQPQRNATRLAARMQRQGVLSKLPDQVATALEQHSVALASIDPKVRFVNMWVALETLVGQDHNSSIIDNIVRTILPQVVHRRINKIIKYLAMCLHEYGFCGVIPDNTGWFYNSTQARVQSDELLLALTGAGGSDVQDKLAEITANHPLLCNRLFAVYKVVRDSKTLLQRLQESEKRINWQLRRIYRARNLLVHTGSPVTPLSYLAPNLEYYFSVTLERVLHDLLQHPNWTLERSFEYRRIQYNYLLDQLLRNPASVTVDHFLEQGTSQRGQESIWPNLSQSSSAPK